MRITENMRAVIVDIQHDKINADDVSPNLVANAAYDLGIELKSEEVVYISDNFI